MRGSGRRRKQNAAEDVAEQLFVSFGLLEGLLPIGGSELEQASAGPAREQAEQVAHIAERLDVVQPAAGQERDEDGVYLGAVVTADKQPVAPANDLAPEVELADV